MWVIGRSASPFSGMSVSSRRTGVRPTWTHQTATWRSRPGSATLTVQRLAVAALDPADRQPGQVVVGVGVLLVAVGVDRLVEVAAAVHAARRRRTAAPCRTSSSCGRRRGRRGRRSRSRATRTGRTRRRSRRSGPAARRRGVAGEPAVGAVRHVRARSRGGRRRTSAMKLVSSRRRLQSTGPARTGIGLRWRVQASRSIRLQIIARPRMPRPVQVVGEARGGPRAAAGAGTTRAGIVGTLDARSACRRMITAGARALNRFRHARRGPRARRARRARPADHATMPRCRCASR